ncbi:Type IV secretory pathway, VirD2 components (relaxase) [Candidatus Burkholderia humilis]|nr:Type IV secretory pathway, VirD2 components (relaxase) [Candidatus Burkholderia humilis]
MVILIIDGVDDKGHYVVLNARDELSNYPVGAVVDVKGSADVRATDRNIVVLASEGLYRTNHHLAIACGQATPDRDPQEVVAAHVRRLEVLRRAGIVEPCGRSPTISPSRGDAMMRDGWAAWRSS